MRRPPPLAFAIQYIRISDHPGPGRFSSVSRSSPSSSLAADLCCREQSKRTSGAAGRHARSGIGTWIYPLVSLRRHAHTFRMHAWIRSIRRRHSSAIIWLLMRIDLLCLSPACTRAYILCMHLSLPSLPMLGQASYSKTHKPRIFIIPKKQKTSTPRSQRHC